LHAIVDTKRDIFIDSQS